GQTKNMLDSSVFENKVGCNRSNHLDDILKQSIIQSCRNLHSYIKTDDKYHYEIFKHDEILRNNSSLAEHANVLSQCLEITARMLPENYVTYIDIDILKKIQSILELYTARKKNIPRPVSEVYFSDEN